ncbi:tubulin folding cofactor D [Oratosquilla oratoria]|uniref:tubulin folding cofactor D n=1 Tax=Oratosquilla oratoria TaxID=337810 RepID=UPI003F77308A
MVPMAEDIGDFDEAPGLSCALDVFQEAEEVRDTFVNIPEVVKDPLAAEKAFEDLKTLLDKYQEQPHLLDGHLEGMLSQLVGFIRDTQQDPVAKGQAFKYMWLVCKVRGHKVVAKKLPHEVKDLTAVLLLMEAKDAAGDFYQSFVLLLWLSIIVYLPFSMASFDTSEQQEPQQKPQTVVQRLLAVVWYHLSSAQKSRDMAALLASRLVTRPDLKDEHMPEFISQCLKTVETPKEATTQTVFSRMGVMRALGLLFKHGRREELMEFSKDVLERILACKVLSTAETPIRKLAVKLITRIGLTFLKPRVASWRYQRGKRTLAINMLRNTAGQNQEALQKELELNEEMELDQEEEEEVPEEIEEVIDYLLQGLKDQDTVVRWSAAKGVGRLTERLAQRLGDDVVGALLDLFSSSESHRAWHGGCLALAELARRGLLVPERLGEVLPVLEKALIYDDLQGQCAVGENIRDAACYVCWAFARAYHPEQLAPLVQRLAQGLLVVALFDREIPVRRAASAAFQEHVGRQGVFPHGIELLTTVDYYAVGIRNRAYLELSVSVAQHKEYTHSLVIHLLKHKVNHWDSAVRELAAKALHNLTGLCPELMAEEVLPELLTMSTCSILTTRHGALFALGNVIHGLAAAAKKRNLHHTTWISNSIIEGVCDVVSNLERRKLYRGLGGEYMKQASSVFIQHCTLAALPIHGKPVIEDWFHVLDECIIYVEDNIRAAGLAALPVFLAEYYNKSPKLVEQYIQGTNTDKEPQRIGYLAALGSLPVEVLEGQLDKVIKCPLEALVITPATASHALSRKQAIQALEQILATVGIRKEGHPSKCFCGGNLKDVLRTLLTCLDDYTMDRRGDIGAWVREAAMEALQTFIKAMVVVDKALLTEELIQEVFTRVAQQSVERIDRTRKVAGTILTALLHSTPPIPYIPCETEVLTILPAQRCAEMNWASESQTLVLLAQLLALREYRYRLILGFVYSAGGLSANLSRFALDALQSFLNDRSDDETTLEAFVEAVLTVLADHQRVDRISQPLIKTMGDLMSASVVLDQVLETKSSLSSHLLALLKRETFQCRDFYKLSSSIALLCELLRLNNQSVTTAALTHLAVFLGYRYPKVRALTASSMLTALQDYADSGLVSDEVETEVFTILEDTPWMDDMTHARSQRDKLCQLMNVQAPRANNAQQQQQNLV